MEGKAWRYAKEATPSLRDLLLQAHHFTTFVASNDAVEDLFLTLRILLTELTKYFYHLGMNHNRKAIRALPIGAGRVILLTKLALLDFHGIFSLGISARENQSDTRSACKKAHAVYPSLGKYCTP
jgi:hypothetical protein